MGWIGVDLDGTLAFYDRNARAKLGTGFIGNPIPLMQQRVKEMLARGKEVRIFTARMSEPDEAKKALFLESLEKWCDKYIGQRLVATNVKDYMCEEIWDDIAKQVYKNTGVALEEELRKYHSPWGPLGGQQ